MIFLSLVLSYDIMEIFGEVYIIDKKNVFYLLL